MGDPQGEFVRQLEVFRTECEAAAQYFYGYLAIHELARRNRRVFDLLNRNALFWNTVLSGLQTSALITLGRIFDPDQRTHNVSRLMALASNNPGIFSKSALASRLPLVDPTELDRTACEPRKRDFRLLKRQVQKHRVLYERNVRDLRRKMLAHKEVVDWNEVNALLSVTRVLEIQRILVFLISLHESLNGPFQNGLKPRLRMRRYSVSRLRRLPSLARRSFDVHERMVGEAAVVLLATTRPNKRLQPTAARTGRRRG